MKQDKATTQVHEICRHCGDPYTVKERIRVYGDNPLMAGYCSAGCYTQGELTKPASPSIPVNDELDMTKPDWTAVFRPGIAANECSFYGLNKEYIGMFSYSVGRHSDIEKWKARGEANAKAICTAVNETYGKGYNPAAMDELYKALGLVLNNIHVIMPPFVKEEIETALQNAKTIKP